MALASAFYFDAVAPVVDDVCPGVAYSAARIGRGSEVLGFDDAVSRDHDWGPRLELFFGPMDRDEFGSRLTGELAARLPHTFEGYSTSFGVASDGVDVLVDRADGEPVAHRVEVHEIGAWCDTVLGFDPRHGVGWFDWLATSSHRLAEVTAGAVFHDGLGDLTRLRAALAYYPHDVWLFILASQWHRISQEEAFVARCAQVGDELGATVIAGRLVRDLMRLCLMMSRRYVPYSKWLGTAFGRSGAAAVLTPTLTKALHATDTGEREAHLAVAYQAAAELHNALGVTDPIEPTTRPFWNRGYRVILADRFARALQSRISDPEIANLPLVGSVDQYLDSADGITAAHVARATAAAILQPPGTMPSEQPSDEPRRSCRPR